MKSIESALASGKTMGHASAFDPISDETIADESRKTVSDIATFDKITSKADDIWLKNSDHLNPKIDVSHSVEIQPGKIKSALSDEEQNGGVHAKPSESLYAQQLMNGLNDSFLPGLGIGILLTCILVMVYGATRIRNDRGANAAVTTCYANANDHAADIIDCEHRNRYIKLQATTTL